MTDQDDVLYDGTSWELLDEGGGNFVFRAAKHAEKIDGVEIGGVHVRKEEFDDVIAALRNVSEEDQ